MERIYIENFCEDLNYKNVILYIGEVDTANLLKALERDMVNKLYRLEYALDGGSIPGRKNFIYIENCDLQNVDYPAHEYMEDGYDIYILYEDKMSGKFYVKSRLG